MVPFDEMGIVALARFWLFSSADDDEFDVHGQLLDVLPTREGCPLIVANKEESAGISGKGARKMVHGFPSVRGRGLP